jgi:hypothetical protein
MERLEIPIALGCPHAKQTYLASATHGYIDYARDELDQLHSEKAQRWARRGLYFAEPWVKWLKLDNSVSINAWGVSTHLYPNWTTPQIHVLTQQLITTYPDRPLWMRSLTLYQQSDLIQALSQAGWLLFPNRQVYLFDHHRHLDLLTKRNNQIDQKLLRTTSLIRCQHHEFTLDDAEQMAKLYDMLYLQKHSQWNAIYTPEYFKQALVNRWVEFLGFRDDQGKLIAFIGIFSDDSCMTTPMLGYDTQLPQSLGLYRLLMGAVLRLSLEQQKLLNFGAGSASFKRMRGGKQR